MDNDQEVCYFKNVRELYDILMSRTALTHTHTHKENGRSFYQKQAKTGERQSSYFIFVLFGNIYEYPYL
jgi:hypothetical protein